MIGIDFPYDNVVALTPQGALTEEDFEVKVIALEGGLDPDRFVREQGIQAYMAALRTAKRHSDYLIDRARQLFAARVVTAPLL